MSICDSGGAGRGLVCYAMVSVPVTGHQIKWKQEQALQKVKAQWIQTW